MQAYDDLAQRHAWLGWCAACSRLVPVGQHDPDWRRQFWQVIYCLPFPPHSLCSARIEAPTAGKARAQIRKRFPGYIVAFVETRRA